MQQQDGKRDRIRKGQFRPDPSAAFRKHEREMHQQSGLQKQRHYVGPVNRFIKRIQLAAVMEAIKNERNKAENIEMNGPGRVPAARKNKKPDEEIKQRGKPEVVLDRRRVFLRRCNQRSLKRRARTPHAVANLCPWPNAE